MMTGTCRSSVRLGLCTKALILATAAWLACSCQKPPAARVQAAGAPTTPPTTIPVNQIRLTGTVQALRQTSVRVPTIEGQSSRLTLTRLAPNGARVQAGDILAEFDRTQQLDNALDAEAKFQDLEHQVTQKIAQNRSDAEERAASLAQAEADVAKVVLQMRKGPVLGEIQRLTNEAKHRIGQTRVSSLEKSNHSHDVADAAALRILELKRNRQKVALERALANAEKMVVRAPLAGMVAHQSVYRGNSMGPPQEGDQLYPGYPLIRIFDPTDMEVIVLAGEPDDAALVAGTRAVVYLDAYPELQFQALFESGSPVATAGFNSPVKTFMARFRLLTNDPRLLPDLSAAVVVQAREGKP